MKYRKTCLSGSLLIYSYPLFAESVPSGSNSCFTLFFTILLPSLIIFGILLWKIVTLIRDNRELKSFQSDLQKKNEELSCLSMTDTLTGLMNRRAIEQLITNEMNRTDRFNTPVSLLVLDLDHFKRVNDNYGHEFGDQVLQHVGEIIRNICRKTDNYARWGGEEFLILAGDTTAVNAVYLAEKLRRKIHSSIIGSLDDLTVSIGVSSFHKGENFNSWFKRADLALYQAKDQGRNRVIVHPDDHSRVNQNDPTRNILRLEWKNEYLCGIKEIDKQHYDMVELSNSVIDSVLNNQGHKAVLNSLDTMMPVMMDHFAGEEKILKDIDYNDLNEHQAQHESLAENFRKLIDLYRNQKSDAIQILNFISQEMIFGHLICRDRDYHYITERHQTDYS